MIGPRSQHIDDVELSAAVMVYNGAQTIGRCLDALLALCDEVCVVDDCSTDATWQIVKYRPVKSVRRRHDTFAGQREFAKSMCRGRWILTMDADEYVTPAMAQAIREAIRRPDAPDGYYVLVRTPYPRGLCGFHVGGHPRLVRSDRCHWVQTDNPHSPLDKTGLRFERIEGTYIDHEPIADVAMALRKSINRSVIVAAQARSHGRTLKGGLLRLIASPLLRFLRLYFRGGGWKYGRDGFVWASLAAFEAFAKYTLLLSEAGDETQLLDGGPGSYPRGAPIVAGKDE